VARTSAMYRACVTEIVGPDLTPENMQSRGIRMDRLGTATNLTR
jgi:hypothetical protein